MGAGIEAGSDRCVGALESKACVQAAPDLLRKNSVTICSLKAASPVVVWAVVILMDVVRHVVSSGRNCSDG